MVFKSKDLKIQLDNFNVPKTISQFISSENFDNIDLDDNSEFIKCWWENPVREGGDESQQNNIWK